MQIKRNLTIGIIARNEEQNVLGCLDSIRMAGHSLHLNWVFVDNGSADRTVALAKAFFEKHKQEYLLVESSENHLGKARNWCLQLAKSKWIYFIDCDCRALDFDLGDWLGRAEQSHQQNPKIVGYGSSNQSPEYSAGVGSLVALFPRLWLGHMNSPQMLAPLIRKDTFVPIRKVRHLSTANALFYIPSLIQCGGFSPHLDRVAEDLELGYRLTAQGFVLCFDFQFPVIHLHNPRLSKWVGKMFKYGFGQGLIALSYSQILFSCRLISLWILVCFVGIAFIVGPMQSRIFLEICFLSYFCFLVVSIWRLKGLQLRQKLQLGKILLLSHFSYGVGQLWGLIHSPSFKKAKCQMKNGQWTIDGNGMALGDLMPRSN